MQLGIYNETDPLKTAVTWGPVGAEAVLAQFYPQHISLFLDDMDVVKARDEALSFSTLLDDNGVKTYMARDVLAEMLIPQSIDFKTVFTILIKKAEDIRASYQTKNHKNYREIIEQLLYMDIKRYGEYRALTLNWKLSLYPFLPLGNLIFARDQMNVLLSKRIRSQMKKNIRRPEVEFYELVYRKIFGDTNCVKIPHSVTFEGGDAYIHDKIIYIGVGARTSLSGAISIYNSLQNEIETAGFRFVIVKDPHPQKRTTKDQMNFMHLDTFSNPVGKNQIAVCLSEAKRRQILFVEGKGDNIKIKKTGTTFLDFLFSEGQEIIAITEEEQQSFGCNFLTINKHHIVVPLKTNKKMITDLKNAGKKVTYANLEEITKGFGAAHCMTGQLFRENNHLTEN